MTRPTIHELIDGLSTQPPTARYAAPPAPAPGAPDTRSPIDRERAAFIDDDGDSILDADGLISEKQLTDLTPAQRKELFARFPLLAAESGRAAVASYFASGRRDQHSN
jgi:hypothetical protein